MGFLHRLRRNRPLERREDASWANLTASGWGNANPRQAEQLSAVFACIDVISSALSSLPPRLYRSTGIERVLVDDDPVLALLETPNRWQTWTDLVSWYVAECLQFGNAVLVWREGELLPIRWQSCSTRMTSSGRIRYDWQFGEGAYNLTGTDFDDTVVHMRDRTDDGVLGRSRLSRVSATIGLAHDTLDSAISAWRKGAAPSGAIKLTGRVTPEQNRQLREQVNQQLAGVSNTGTVMILDNGSEWQSMSQSLREAQALEARQFMVAEVARIYAVPPPLIQDYTYNTFTNSNTAGQWFAKFTLASWARRFETAFTRTLLPEGQHLELDLSAFARGDMTERWAAYKVALESGVLSAEEVKRLEGW